MRFCRSQLSVKLCKRAFGDFEYKDNKEKKRDEQQVSVEPVIDFIKRDEKNDMFVALCCDGIFDVFRNRDLATHIDIQMKYNKDLNTIAGDICDTAVYKVCP